MPLPLPFCGDSTDRGAGLSCTEAWEDADEAVDDAGDDELMGDCALALLAVLADAADAGDVSCTGSVAEAPAAC